MRGTESGHDRGEGGRDRRESDVLLLAAGIADLAVDGLTTALGGLRGLLGRADASDLVADGRQDLRARGRLVIDRYATPAPAHLELLARQVAARRTERGDV